MLEARKFLRLTAVLTIISVLLFLLMLLRVDPLTSGKSALVYFLIFLFLSLAGILTLASYSLRKVLQKDKIPLNNYNVSLRQSILVSTAIVGLLILKSMGSLAWWDGLLLIASLVFLEMFFRS